MTERLYYTDSHLAAFSGKVLSCKETEKGFAVVLDRTAFFPEGGGQPGDIGTLDGVEVTDTQITDGEIYHYCRSALAVGETVEGQLDFARRYAMMQNHSGEHIVSGIVHSMFGYDNVGFHLGSEDVTMDYNGVIERDALDEIERLANEAVYANLPIITEFPSAEKLASMSYRSKKELTGEVRIVTVEGIDVCACCAPHVSQTGEIGIIKLLDYAHYKGGVRVHMLCGRDAILDYARRYTDIHNIACSLSVKQSEITGAVDGLCRELSETKKALGELRSELIAKKVDALVPTDGNICIFEDYNDMNLLRKTALAAVEKCRGVCAVFGGRDGEYNYVITSNNRDLRAASGKINEVLNGRGGGRPDMISGSAKCSREVAEKWFSDNGL